MGNTKELKFDFSFIKNLRRKKDMTAEELAKRAGLTRGTVVNIESNNANPTVQTLEALGNVLGKSPSDLMRLAEGVKLETAESRDFLWKGLLSRYIQFRGFEFFHMKAPAGSRKDSLPEYHHNTMEVCYLIEGRLDVYVGGQAVSLEPGQAVRFNAMQDHWFDVIEDSEFLLIHHNNLEE